MARIFLTEGGADVKRIASLVAVIIAVVFCFGVAVAAPPDKMVIDKIKKSIPNMQLISDDSSSGDFGQTENKPDTKVTPNSYEGMLVAQGLSDAEQFQTDEVQRCVKVYEDATNEKVVSPTDLKPDANGNLIKVYAGIQDRCRELGLHVVAHAGEDVLERLARDVGQHVDASMQEAMANAMAE